MYKCRYFTIKELVSPTVFDKFGEFSWSFFDADFLRDFDFIRDEWEKVVGKANAPLTINNWNAGLTQCGLRSNQDPIVKEKKSVYCSAHCLAKAVDLHTKNASDTGKFWEFVKSLIVAGKLKTIRRLEDKNVTVKQNYVHADAFQTSSNKLEVFMP